MNDYKNVGELNSSSNSRRSSTSVLSVDSARLDNEHDMMLTTDDDVKEIDSSTRRFLCWRLPRRQWCWAVAVSVLVVVTVMLLTFFLTIVQLIFQMNVNNVKMTVNYMDIKSMYSNATTNTVDMELSLHVAYDAPIGSSMDTARAEMLFNGKAFGVVTLPAQSFSKNNKTFEMVVRDTAVITDVDAFNAMSVALVRDKEITVSTSAEITIHALGLSASGVTLTRDFKVKAMHEFADSTPKLNHIELSECSSAEYKMRINATLDNVSQVGLEGIGALNMSVYHDEDYLGQAISTDTTTGLPRGSTAMMLELTILRTSGMQMKLLKLGASLMALRAQFYISGNHPYATQVPLLREGIKALNISLLSTDGIDKVGVGKTCDLVGSLIGF